MLDAFEEASTALGVASGESKQPDASAPREPAPDGSAASGGDSSDSQPAGETKPPAQGTGKQYTIQGAIEHIRQMVSQGRESELSSEERGVLDAFRRETAANERTAAVREHEAAQQEEREFRDMFLELDAERQEDPELFSARLLEEPDLAAFYKAYRTDHPGLSASNPDAKPSFDKAKVDEMVGATRQEVTATWVEGIDSYLDGLSQKHGLDYTSLRSTHGRQGVGTLLDKVIEAAVDAAAGAKAQDLAKGIAAKEIEAFKAEHTATYFPRAAVTPRPFGSSAPRDPLTINPSAAGPGPFSIKDAFEAAEKSLSR